VVQGDQRGDPRIPQSAQLLSVVLDGALVELSRPGFDSGPLEAHPVDPDAQVGQQGGVLRPAFPMVGGHHRRGAVSDAAGQAGPVEPAIGPIAALDLRWRACDPQAKVAKGE